MQANHKQNGTKQSLGRNQKNGSLWLEEENQRDKDRAHQVKILTKE